MVENGRQSFQREINTSLAVYLHVNGLSCGFMAASRCKRVHLPFPLQLPPQAGAINTRDKQVAGSNKNLKNASFYGTTVEPEYTEKQMVVRRAVRGGTEMKVITSGIIVP